MKEYRNTTTQEIWTEDEIYTIYNGEPSLYEEYATLEVYIDHLVEKGELEEIEEPIG